MEDSAADTISFWDFYNDLEIGELNAPSPFDPMQSFTDSQAEEFMLELTRYPLHLELDSGSTSSVLFGIEEDDLSIEVTLPDSLRATPMSSSNSEIMTISPYCSLPEFVQNVDKARESTRSSSVTKDNITVKLPPMFQTKMDCPRDGECHINSVKSLSGGSTCKGKDAIGSKHKFSCLCGLKWQENNWRERDRLSGIGEPDIRGIQFLPTTSPSPFIRKSKLNRSKATI